jgi:creatinine amidohydrolase
MYLPITFLFLASILAAQIRPLHTRDLTRLAHPQVAKQLQTSDVIFIPVGAVETNGTQPSDRDYVYALAYAMTMAEQTGGLYMPGLVWSYPGTTGLASSSIYLSPQAGITQLKQLATSLLRQGFRRQVYISASHGPAPLTAGTMVREFFEETQVPLLYINMDSVLPKLKLDPAQSPRLLYGAHSITSRIEDLPLRGDFGANIENKPADLPENEGLRDLGKLGFSGSLTLGSWIPHVMAHSGTGPLPADASERERWGREGADLLRRVVRDMKMPEAMAALQKHDQFTQKYIVKKPQ